MLNTPNTSNSNITNSESNQTVNNVSPTSIKSPNNRKLVIIFGVLLVCVFGFVVIWSVIKKQAEIKNSDYLLSSPNTNTTVINQTTKKYTDDEIGYSFTYPARYNLHDPNSDPAYVKPYVISFKKTLISSLPDTSNSPYDTIKANADSLISGLATDNPKMIDMANIRWATEESKTIKNIKGTNVFTAITLGAYAADDKQLRYTAYFIKNGYIVEINITGDKDALEIKAPQYFESDGSFVNWKVDAKQNLINDLKTDSSKLGSIGQWYRDAESTINSLTFSNANLPGNSSIIFGNYKLTLPSGWLASQVEQSIIADQSNEGVYCWLEPENDPKYPACKYSIVTNNAYSEIHVRITDTDKVPLGGGGSVMTIQDTQYLGPTVYNASFTYSWHAIFKDTTGSNDLVKINDDKGNAQIYWISGCLKKDLCISMNNSPDSSDNGKLVSEFNNFVNQLIIAE